MGVFYLVHQPRSYIVVGGYYYGGGGGWKKERMRLNDLFIVASSIEESANQRGNVVCKSFIGYLHHDPRSRVSKDASFIFLPFS